MEKYYHSRDKLLSDPKKAILNISIPMIIAMVANTVYNLVDAIWVSGLGADALSAVGLFYPFYYLTLAISSAISVGGGVALARRIGAEDRKGAGNILSHSYIFAIVVSLAYSAPLLVFSDNMFQYLGADDILPQTLSYARVMFAGTLIIFLSDLSNAVLRNQGDAKRSMFAMLLGTCLNMVLDPIFIYQLDMGIAGAAWATVISYLSSCIMAHYWLVAKRQSYADIDLRQRSISKDVSLDIFKVGIPASFQTVSFSVYMFLLNGIVLSVGGTDGVAILSTGWRVTNMATLPLIGMAMGVSTVTGATFGAKQYGKLKETYLYSLRLGIVFESLIALAVYLLAPYIAMLFTQGDGAARIYEGLVTFLRVVCIYLPVASLSMFSSSFFNGIGKGINGLSVTLLRTVIFTVPAAYMLGIVMDYGLLGIWSSIVVANLLSGMLSFLWARSIIGKMESQWLGIA